MSIERKQVGPTEVYFGRELRARYMGPDLLGFVNDVELNGFYLTAEDARAAGRRQVDAEIKAQAEAKAKRERESKP